MSRNSFRTVFSHGWNATKAAFKPSWFKERLNESQALRDHVGFILPGLCKLAYVFNNGGECLTTCVRLKS